MRQRKCNNPPPSNGGANCMGKMKEEKSCKIKCTGNMSSFCFETNSLDFSAILSIVRLNKFDLYSKFQLQSARKRVRRKPRNVLHARKNRSNANRRRQPKNAPSLARNVNLVDLEGQAEVEETNPNAKTKLEPRNVRSKRRIAKRARKSKRTVKRLARNARNKQHLDE